ncbi:phosphoribosyl-ATP diphosphatase [Trichlorobacter ammonificans]|uniref:Phosphoribosyl-ATP pyrophosphatase n=1 Tax=Trichlorobacter ammonificans TaxID=2916410 RepID=A0ABM9DBV6_9BACT|nr:phosphoribosyl-ATP diphosphatase [Trichlorobacter ammonificans]CAH2031841.1 Phosphoribosyl-ATP pyrophosphatase [Trichlorobacter ammonificans]
MSDNRHMLDELYQVILSRKNASPDSSYTASLLQGGLDRILKKVGEEATEVVIAGKGGEQAQLTCEAADLCYHLLVLLAARDVPVEAVWDELRRRFGTSGIAEKASRKLPPA